MHKANRQAAIHLEGVLSDLGVTAGEAHVLSYLNVYGPRPVGELVRVFGHKKPTMTSVLDRLERRGFVTREVNSRDRRSFVVGTTPEGGRIGVTARARVERFEEEIAKRTTPQDLRGLASVARAIAEVTGVDLDRSRTPKPREGGRKQA